MKPTRAPFAPITPDIDDEKLERLAADKGVAALVRPVSGGGDKRPNIPDDSLAATAGEAAPCGYTKNLNMNLPGYVWTELKIRAAQRQSTVKHVVMTALVKDGITIREADMIEDGRRMRGPAGTLS